ncbi:ribosome-associated translation inhibitor RaiA [Candidatus Kaiserbacteria bacterium]|nr:ribosome-associated translation inhibitor RaiA [Candidatus Kaiserbacteria bacterium]
MNITIKAKRSELTPATREFIEEKFSALEKLVASAIGPVTLSCEIEESIAVERAGARYRAEGNLSVDGRLFRAEASSNTLEGAVDRVRDELARELGSARGKKRNLLKRGGEAIKRMLRFGR